MRRSRGSGTYSLCCLPVCTTVRPGDTPTVCLASQLTLLVDGLSLVVSNVGVFISETQFNMRLMSQLNLDLRDRLSKGSKDGPGSGGERGEGEGGGGLRQTFLESTQGSEAVLIEALPGASLCLSLSVPLSLSLSPSLSLRPPLSLSAPPPPPLSLCNLRHYLRVVDSG